MIIQFQQGCNDSRSIDTHAHTVQYCAAWPAPIITSRYYLSIPIPVSVCSGGLKRGSGANLMIRGLNSHLGSRNSGHTGTAALQYLTMCKYFLADYALIFCMTPVRCNVLYAHFLAANFHVCIVWIIWFYFWQHSHEIVMFVQTVRTFTIFRNAIAIGCNV